MQSLAPTLSPESAVLRFIPVIVSSLTSFQAAPVAQVHPGAGEISAVPDRFAAACYRPYTITTKVSFRIAGRGLGLSRLAAGAGP